MFQWEAERQARFKQLEGIDIHKATLAQETDFFMREMKSFYPSTYAQLMSGKLDTTAATGGFTEATTALNRLCSADLPDSSAFYNADTGLGYNGGRIFMNGEESGTEGRAFAHFATGIQRYATLCQQFSKSLLLGCYEEFVGVHVSHDVRLLLILTAA